MRYLESQSLRCGDGVWEGLEAARSGRRQLLFHLRSGSMRDDKKQKVACAISFVPWEPYETWLTD